MSRHRTKLDSSTSDLLPRARSMVSTLQPGVFRVSSETLDRRITLRAEQGQPARPEAWVTGQQGQTCPELSESVGGAQMREG